MKYPVMILALGAPLVFAQATETEEVIVKASLLRQSVGELVAPATIVDQQQLRDAMAGSVAEAIAETPGANLSSFGPGVGQPVLRGHSGARVRTLQSGLDSFDAASVSPDHAVSSDPFSASGVEVLRGPATLAYGSGAIGGVVNTLDQAIPEKPLDGANADLHLAADNGRHGRIVAARAAAGDGIWAARATGARQKTDDIEIPGHAEAEPEPGEAAESTLDNSATQMKSALAGVSRHGESGFVGVALDRYQGDYGVPGGHGHGHAAGEAVTIDLDQRRLRLAGEWVNPAAGIEALRAQGVHSQYRHKELEGTEVGTRFEVDGRALRLELDHAAIAGYDGVIGVHLRQRDFDAQGEEAFVPSSVNRAEAVFVVEEWQLSDALALEFGGRYERERYERDAGSSVSFSLGSLSVGGRLSLSDNWQLVGSLSHSERAPTAEELFADGHHVATNTFEVGNADLDKESADNLDIGLRWQGASTVLKFSAFHTEFSDFVYGASRDCNNDGVADRIDESAGTIACTAVVSPSDPDHDEEPLLQLQTQTDANYSGFELELRQAIWAGDGQQFELSGFADHVRAQLKDAGFVPRIPADRVGLGLHWTANRWQGQIRAIHAFEVRDIAELETSSDAYTLVNASLRWTPMDALSLGLTGHNLMNETIRRHASYLKDSAPAPGRFFGFSVNYHWGTE